MAIVNILNAIDTFHTKNFSIDTAQEIYDEYSKNPRPMIVYIDCTPQTNNEFNHRWWQHITRHITFGNTFSLIKTLSSTTFLAWFGAAILIQKSYVTVRKIHNFFTVRSSDITSENMYKKIKKYEVLFLTYKQLNKVLYKCNIRSYFMYDSQCDENIDDMLAYITMYEKKTYKNTQEND